MSDVVRYPNYLSNYACKLGKCRRTCCSGAEWDITLSPSEYEGACAVARGDAELERLSGLVVAPASEGGAASVACGEDGLCALLDDEGRCSWRMQTGCDLCSLCRDFPSSYVRVFDDVYACPSGACEAVLEAMLVQEGPVELCAREDDGAAAGAGDDAAAADGAGERTYQLCVTDDNASRNSIYGAYEQFAELGLSVLQDTRYSLDERVAILVSCLNMVDKMIAMGSTARLDVTIQSMLEPRRIEAMFDGYARDVHDANPIPRACGEMYMSCLQSHAYADVAQRVLDGMGLAAVRANRYTRPHLRTVDADRLAQRTQQQAGFLADKQEFLAKVMASVYLHGMVPIANPGVWPCTKYFALCYALLKCGIVGYFESAPTDEELVDLLVVLLRAFTHNEGLYRNALAWMDGNKLDDVRDIVKFALY